MAAALIDQFLNETDNTNSKLLEFYELNSTHLNKICLGEIPLVVLDRIASLLHTSLQKDSEWMTFLNKLGIVNTSEITRILFTFKASGQFPIFIALAGYLNQKIQFGDFVKFLIEEEKFLVLSDIKSFVEGLLRKKIDFHVNKSSQLVDSELEYKINFEVEKEKESNCENSRMPKDFCKLEKNNWLSMERNRLIPICSNLKNVNQESRNDSFKCHTKETITVFIPHAEIDGSDAQKLSRLLEEEQMIVRTLSDLDYIITMNLSEAVSSLLNMVDFIVPVVSESFVRQIHSINYSLNTDDISEEDNFTNDSINRYIYQLLFNEYLQNKCLNFRVRPVLVPGMKRQILKFDPLLFYSLSLWKAVPKLINILKKTKQKFFLT